MREAGVGCNHTPLAAGCKSSSWPATPIVLSARRRRPTCIDPAEGSNHSTALFGVYGMLGLGLMLFCLRALSLGNAWKDSSLAVAFWRINIGLSLMVLLSMLPVGLLQGWASVKYCT